MFQVPSKCVRAPQLFFVFFFVFFLGHIVSEEGKMELFV